MCHLDADPVTPGPTWTGATPPPRPPVGLRGALRIAVRGTTLSVLLVIALPLHVGLRRLPRIGPATADRLTQAVCRAACVLLGLTRCVRGEPARGLLVANHTGWIDIFALNACAPMTFAAKAEVRAWPAIGWLARATATVFVERRRLAAGSQAEALTAALHRGARVMVFPEGTSTDGRRVLPFFSVPFAAAVAAAVPVQPVSVVYAAPPGRDARFWGWWGSMGFLPHVLAVLAAPPRGSVTVTFHPPLDPWAVRDRKALAVEAERTVRRSLTAALGDDVAEGRTLR